MPMQPILKVFNDILSFFVSTSVEAGAAILTNTQGGTKTLAGSNGRVLKGTSLAVVLQI
jgi:hypothetical protein